MNSMLRILSSLSSCCDVDMLLQGSSVIQHYVFFFPPGQWKRSSVRCAGAPSRKYRWVVHSLSFRRSVFGPTTAVLLDDIARGIEVTRSCSARTQFLCEDFNISLPQLQKIFPICTQDIAVWKNFRRSLCCSCRRLIPAILC